MKIPRKVLFALMGVGAMGALGSVGTMAVFTASFDYPNNTFTSGTLMLKDTTGFTSAATTLGSATAPNLTGTDPRTSSECSTAVVAQTCTNLLKSVNVASSGMEPGQYLRGTITITNAGTLPATVAMQVQNVKTNNGDNSLYGSGASGYAPCPSDIAGTGSPGTSGAQLTSGATTPGYNSAAVPITGCQDLGTALRITVQDVGGAGSQCVFGNDTGGSVGSTGTNGNDRLQAPGTSGLGVGASGLHTYVATGTSGACDDLSQTNVLGSPSSPVLPGSNPKDAFGLQTATPGNTSFAALSGGTSMIFIAGGGTTKSVVNQAALGGNLTQVPQWAASESHTFTVTLAFPNTGTTLLTDHNSDRLTVGKDNPYQGGAASFDLYWFAIQ